MPFAEDLSVFVNSAEFGTEATYTPQGGTASTVDGIFDRNYAEPMREFEGNAPAFSLPLASVPSVAQGDALTIESVSYKIVGVQLDGLGFVTLKLEEQ